MNLRRESKEQPNPAKTGRSTNPAITYRPARNICTIKLEVGGKKETIKEGKW